MKKKSKRTFDFVSKKHLIIAGVVSGVLGVSGLGILIKPPTFLRVQEVMVTKSTPHLSEMDIVKLAGVKKGSPLLTLSLEKVRERILRYPWVHEVSLSKSIPGRLVIEVQEQTPVALLEVVAEAAADSENETGLYLINGDGKIFKKLESADPKDLPLLTGLNKEEIRSHLQYYVRVLSWFDREEFKDLGVSELSWHEGELTLFTKDPCIQISFGKDGSEDLTVWESRMQRLIDAWPQIHLASKSPRAIDLTLERRLVVKEKILAGNN